MSALGLDIGYSNLKAVFTGGDGTVKTVTLPAGAGLVGARSVNILEPQTPGIRVEVEGDQYVVGVPQSEFPSQTRQLATDYTRTPQYKALFFGALSLQPSDEIEVLVTGLPVDVYRKGAEVEWLAQLMRGKHEIGDGRIVDVKDVEVIPQPLGSFLSCVEGSKDDRESLASETVLVVDPGFFSCDYTLLSQGRIVGECSNHNCHAMSRFVEEMGKEIVAEFGGAVPFSVLEEVVRAKKTEVYLQSIKRDISGIYARVAKRVIADATKDILNRMRSLDLVVNIVVLTGGGASYWAEEIGSYFPGAKIVLTEDPVAANAMGFYHHARVAYVDAA